MLYTCTCKYCGKEFESRFKDVVVCSTCKNRPCEVCGKEFLHAWPYNQHCCSKECTDVFRKDPERNRLINEKKIQNVRTKYGVDNVAKLQSVREKIQASKLNPCEYYFEKQSRLEQASPLIRTCILCGKEFEAIGSQTTCSGPHYKKCAICGTEFEYKHISDKKVTCSKKCAAEYRRRTILSVTRVCEYCGKEFHSPSNTAKYCEGPHYKKCEICGRDFKVDLSSGVSLSDLPHTCSRMKCVIAQRIKTSQATYGVASPSQTDAAREQARQRTINSAEQRKQTCLERYGAESYMQTEEGRQRMSEIMSEPNMQKQIRRTNQQRYGVNHAMQIPEFARKHSNSQFHCIASDGTRVDSAWELIVYEFFKRNGIEFEYNTASIPIEYNGVTHYTHIDFNVGGLLFEVKGGHLLEGTFDNRPNVVPIEYKLKAYRQNHVIIITDASSKKLFGSPNSTESNGLKYLDKCPEPLIGVDLALFDKPNFPYAEDRPHCFYDVRVDNSPSSFEAFNDEKIRWKMILNRINYVGGFIGSKQILTAMNVTRTCKQPSWFSKSLAERIINQYCTSHTIVDLFAGWGMRNDAAVALGRQYVGIDLNPKLVKWHKEHGRNIELGDAHTFTFDKECSVFICPPYSDPKTGRCFEDYNFKGFDQSAKALSQCNWLRIVMNNIPNAREYVMVCKIVDEGWEPFVVETLVNKSHLGTNHEYVVRVQRGTI